MIVKIISHRGDHNAVMGADIAEQVFDKLTGKREDALPVALKTQVPDTWQELDALWNPGKPTYGAFSKHGADIKPVKTFDPQEDDLLFIAPVMGG